MRHGRRGQNFRRGLIAACCLGALLLGGFLFGGNAPRNDGERERNATGDTLAAHIADTLRTRPLYVDDRYAGIVPGPQRKKLIRRLSHAGQPTFVVVAPLMRAGPYRGKASELLLAVHAKLLRAGLYVGLENSGRLTVKVFGIDLSERRATRAARQANERRAYQPLPAKVDALLNAVAARPG